MRFPIIHQKSISGAGALVLTNNINFMILTLNRCHFSYISELL